MKTKLKTLVTIFALFISIVAVFAQQAAVPTSGSSAIAPNTGLPVKIDPNADWKDPQWKDPSEVLPNLAYEGLPVNEVVRQLRERFNNDFDIIVPHSDNGNGFQIDPASYYITLQLHNVTASEIFGAMNTEFEVENTSFRWQLTMNGTRPTAVLRIMPKLIPPAPPLERQVFFVGDLIDSGMTVPQINKTISDVWEKAYGQAGVIQFYEPAQLLIVNGTRDQIVFINQTLAALHQKTDFTRFQSARDSAHKENKKSSESNLNSTGPKTNVSSETQ